MGNKSETEWGIKLKLGKIVIDKELCKGCRYCIMACPNNAIEIDKRFNSMGFFPAHVERPENCTGCTICAEMCPDIAIEVWQDDRG